MVPGVLIHPRFRVTELLGSLLGLFRVDGHWRGERRGSGSLGSALLLAPVLITGNLTEDPERRYTPSGKAVVSASIANNEHYTDAQGEEKKVTTFVNLQIWGKAAENFGNLVKKGQEIFVDGKLRMDEWTDKQTNTRRTRLYLLVENWQFTRRPSGLKTVLKTQSVWPWKVVSSLPVSASQSRAVLFSEAVSTRRPSGLKTALLASSVWPWKVVSSLPVSSERLTNRICRVWSPTRIRCLLKTALCLLSQRHIHGPF